MFLLSIPFTVFHVATHTHPIPFFTNTNKTKNKKQKLPKVHEEEGI